MAKPITPSDVAQAKARRFPDFVIGAFNELIAKHWDGKQARFEQKEVLKLILKHANATVNFREGDAYTSKTIYDNSWLDVESTYELAGWKVEYDKPGYNETYDATFIFKK